jgi:hypothetical protein
MASRSRNASSARAVGCLVFAFVLLIASGVAVFLWLRDRGVAAPVPGQQRCVATAAGRSVAVDLDQAHFASIIVGLSVRRGLAPRAASIAMATAYQETGIRNLDYGDRDSVGLFQQRPSQGWGTEAQLKDPYYATGKFYDALVKIKNWKTDDVNDVAQKVQRSGHPEAYRDHEADARVLASTLAGRSPGGFSCLERQGTPGDGAALVTSVKKTFGKLSSTRTGDLITIKAKSKTLAWAFANHSVANSKAFGVVSVQVGGQRWSTDQFNLPVWSRMSPAVAETEVRISVRP